MPSGLFHLNSWTGPFSKVYVLLFFIVCFIKKNPVFNANSVDPDRTPRSVASYLGLHNLSMSILWDTIGKDVPKA